MVKKLKEQQNKIVLVMGMVLIAATAFAGGILVEKTKSERKEPLVFSEKVSQDKTLSLSLEKQEGTKIFAKTSPRATVKLGEGEIIQTDQEGRFQFDLGRGEVITVYQEDNLIQVNFGGLSEAKNDNISPPGIFPEKEESQKQEIKAEETKKEVPQEKVYVGSKNSNKYHLPSCRWVAKIKPENQVWFSSEEEAQNKGYKPCATCLK